MTIINKQINKKCRNKSFNYQINVQVNKYLLLYSFIFIFKYFPVYVLFTFISEFIYFPIYSSFLLINFPFIIYFILFLIYLFPIYYCIFSPICKWGFSPCLMIISFMGFISTFLSVLFIYRVIYLVIIMAALVLYTHLQYLGIVDLLLWHSIFVLLLGPISAYVTVICTYNEIFCIAWWQ